MNGLRAGTSAAPLMAAARVAAGVTSLTCQFRTSVYGWSPVLAQTAPIMRSRGPKPYTHKGRAMIPLSGRFPRREHHHASSPRTH
jgi:hypothetical protein